MLQISPQSYLFALFFFILNPSLSGQSSSVNCFCPHDSLSNISLNWHSLDSSYKLKFVNDLSIDSNGFSSGSVRIIILDSNTNNALNQYILKMVNLGECDRSYYDYCVVNSLKVSPKVIIIREEYHNDCENIHEVEIFKLELSNGKLEYIKIF